MEVLALEEHVDYWDYIGWKDPFSSPAWSRRQADYQGALGRSRNYTPQMVVDGTTELVGSDEERARALIAAAAKAERGALSLERKGRTLRIRASSLPARDEPAEVLLAIAESGLQSKVEAGENAGRTLQHAPVARSLKLIGEVKPGEAAASLEVELDVPLSKLPNQLRAIVFLQLSKSRRIIAAGALGL